MSIDRKVEEQSKGKSETKPSEKKEDVLALTIPEILGGPPETGTSITQTENMRKNSYIVLDISPCVPDPKACSITVFRLSSAWTSYSKLLKTVGFKPSASHNSNKAIRLACMAENFPTDTFTNEYGEHFLNSITETAGSGFGEFAQMMGKKDFLSATEAFGGTMGEAAPQFGEGMLAKGMTGIGEWMAEGSKSAKAKIDALKSQKSSVGQIASVMSELLAGARIDFPQVWKNSSYTPTFSCSVRLYNPNPGSTSSTKEFIIAPLAAILTLALPQASGTDFYSWPFFCEVNCPGLFKIPMGAITNISITKGGDTGLIAFNQRVQIVDIKIDFVNLFNTLVISDIGEYTRPTLKGYLNNMLDEKTVESPYSESGSAGFSIENIFSKKSGVISSVYDTLASAPARIQSSLVNTANSLLSRTPFK